MLIEGWGEVGQQRLKSATVFVAGAGVLGSPVSIYQAENYIDTIKAMMVAIKNIYKLDGPAFTGEHQAPGGR